MKRFSFTTLTAIIGLACISCSQPPEPQSETEDQIHHHSIFTFGTIVDISLYGVDEKLAEQAFEQLESDFRYMHVTWHPRLNNAVARNNLLITSGEWFSDAPSVRELVELGIDLHKSSEGLFNPAIGKLIRLWNFSNGDEHETGLPPDAQEIKKLVDAKPGMDDLELSNIRMRSKNPDVMLNFGGLAKGLGIDRTMDVLKTMGIKHAIINAGGDLRAIGQHGKRPWKIGILHPRKENTVLAQIETRGDESIYTSGDYQRFFEYEGKRYHHILDPRTGYPATGSQSVTVIHQNGAIADAAATALFIAGPEHWHRIARSMGIHHVLLIDNQGTVHMNPKMKQRVQFKVKPERIVISKPLS